MEDDLYTKPRSLGFQALFNDFGKIIVCQEDSVDDTLDIIELSAEEAEDLSRCLLELAKKLRG